MLKKILINNMIALLAYGLSTALHLLLAFKIFQAIESFNALTLITVFLYVICGFLLNPVEKHLLLSSLSIPVVLIVLLVISMGLGEYGGAAYFFLNPIVGTIIALDFLKSFYLLILFTSPLFPSLLFCLGMALRKRIVKR